jgi:hypothetical protein
MRMDVKHTSMWGVWIILSIAVLVALGVGLYLIIKHFTKKHCKPDCTKKCGPNSDGCGGSCKCPQEISTWNSQTINKAKTSLQQVAKNHVGTITDDVLRCAFQKIMYKYKTLKDFMNDLNNKKVMPSLIQIVKDCMKISPVDPSNSCQPGEKFIDGKCVPSDWKNISFNEMLKKSLMSNPNRKIDNEKADCILTKLMTVYPNPQIMVQKQDSTVLNTFINECIINNSCKLSDYCISQGQNSSTNMACQETIDYCMKTTEKISNDDNECILNLTKQIKDTCSKRHKRGDDVMSYSYCAPNTSQNSNKKCECIQISDLSEIQGKYFYSRGPNCEEQSMCNSSDSCKPHNEVSVGIY